MPRRGADRGDTPWKSSLWGAVPTSRGSFGGLPAGAVPSLPALRPPTLRRESALSFNEDKRAGTGRGCGRTAWACVGHQPHAAASEAVHEVSLDDAAASLLRGELRGGEGSCVASWCILFGGSAGPGEMGGSHRASGLGSAPCPCHWRGGCGQEGDKTFLLPAPWRGGLPLQQAPGCFRQAAGCCWGKRPPNATSPQFRVARGWQGAPVAPQCCEHPVKALP